MIVIHRFRIPRTDGAGKAGKGRGVLSHRKAEWDNNPAALACKKRERPPGPQNEDADRRKEAHRCGASKKTAKASLLIFDEQERDHP